VGVGGLTVSGVSRNRGGFVKCVAIQKRLGIPAVGYSLTVSYKIFYSRHSPFNKIREQNRAFLNLCLFLTDKLFVN
jgi:hypothetical protein